MIEDKNKSFNDLRFVLEQLSPDYTALSRQDAVDFYLQEAERKFRQIIDEICKGGATDGIDHGTKK